MYQTIQNLLLLMPPEVAHDVALKGLNIIDGLGCAGALFKPHKVCAPVSFLGMNFPNPIGLSAGLDKNGDYIDALGQLGFGFLEVGTVTPRPQKGNPKPRLFRLPEYAALINRMGFNNKGVDHLVERLKTRRFDGVVGVNIGKNKTTPAELAVEDYTHCLKKVYPLADYITINISSPNTPGLRDFQRGEMLRNLLQPIAQERTILNRIFRRHVPTLIKISPDLEQEEIKLIAQACIEFDFEGVIATNTSSDKTPVARNSFWKEEGGLSGKPITKRANQVLRKVREHLPNEYVLIGVGGIMDAQQAIVKMTLGADLVQLYTGLIYRGPRLIKECVIAASQFQANVREEQLKIS